MAINSTEGLEPGQFFTRHGGDVWVVESVCREPTVGLRRIYPPGDPDKVRAAIGSSALDGFLRLVPIEGRR